MRIEFFLPLKKVPTVTAQQKRITVRNGKPAVYNDARLKEAESLFCSLLWPYVPEEEITDPVRLQVSWFFKDTKERLNHPIPKTTRPDTDNLQKLFKDCMTKVGYWKDDAIVYSERISKFWASNNGIYVKIETDGE